MDNELVVKNELGNDKKINVVDIVQDNLTGKEYIFYTEEGKDELIASILIEREDSYTLEVIKDDKEWDLVEELMENMILIEGDDDE